MSVQLTITAFVLGVFLAAFLDVSSTAEKVRRQTDAMRERNTVGFWIGWCAWVSFWLLVTWSQMPIALIYFFACIAGAVVYCILSPTLQRLTRKA